jgi:hypothetical protein
VPIRIRPGVATVLFIAPFYQFPPAIPSTLDSRLASAYGQSQGVVERY